MRDSARVLFIDTSVVLGLFDVPGKNESRERALREFAEYRVSKDMVLPVTAVIETGNHIAHVANGSEHRRAAQGFDAMPEQVQNGTAPWIPNELTWDAEMVGRLRNPGVPGEELVTMLEQKIGAGDCLILAERAHYASDAGVGVDTIGIWTLDQRLPARE